MKRNLWNTVLGVSIATLLVLMTVAAGIVYDSVSDDIKGKETDKQHEINIVKFNELPTGGETRSGDCGEADKFESLEEMDEFLNISMPEPWRGEYYILTDSSLNFGVGPTVAMEGGSGDDYSGTNIQVAGVDEADIVKTDGEFIYVISGRSVVILKAYPSSEAKVLSKIMLDYHPYELFVTDSKLVLFSNVDYGTQIDVYSITDRANPEIFQVINFGGWYLDSRLIANHVYVIMTHSVVYYDWENEDYEIMLPEIKNNGETRSVDASEICYFDEPTVYPVFNLIVSIDLEDKTINQETYLSDNSWNVYVSQKNIYISGYGNWWWGTDETTVHKLAIDEGKIEYNARGTVPGMILNQFSMDEFKGYFRVATSNWSASNVYVLDGSLEIVGKLEGLAPDETLHSARFMATRCYLVTFKKIDPFFVIDLSDPTDPKVLGELKIPGVSDYLHPYDVNHIIGLGKDTYDMGGFAWFQGVKLSLFDVTDLSNPKEISQVVIGDRGTSSLALYDHKAFLFSKSKNLLALPISLYEVEEGSPPETYGEFVWQGVYVFHISVEDGFRLRGKVTHYADGERPGCGNIWRNDWWFLGLWPPEDHEPEACRNVVRTLYIDNVLYTVSEKTVKLNNLGSLTTIKDIDL
jgi:inhibitor of cysteine peptidase